ncbi:hypothetical protein [Neobacillus sp. FSL H8-0543]|uniref:hypothetical protein n=1 Tax=Neobacillus sp. FSL H8-0543 TaxID=2954672 RepID=UPI0031581C19
MTMAAINNWEIAKIIAELDKVNQMKMNDHTSIQQAPEPLLRGSFTNKKRAEARFLIT